MWSEFYTMRTPAAKRDYFALRRGPGLAAWLVHIYTASGAFLAFVAAWGVVRGNDRLALAAMFVATLVDATDGMLARRARVKDVLPHVDGARIDDLVDYLTFVFVPLLLLDTAGGLPHGARFPVAAAVLMSSLYGFVAPDAKSADHYFTGFPSYWNIVVLYLLLFRTTPRLNAAVLLVLSALIFVRIGYIYPSRTTALRPLTLTLASIWTVAVGAIIWLWPSPPRWLAIGSLAFPVYYVVASLYLHVTDR